MLAGGEAEGGAGGLAALERAINREDFIRALLIFLDPAWVEAAAGNAGLSTLLRARAAVLLASLGCQEEARGLWAQVAAYWAHSGHPARALAAAVQLRALGADVGALLDQFSALYHIQSPHLDAAAGPTRLDVAAVRVDLEALEARLADLQPRAQLGADGGAPWGEAAMGEAAMGALLEQLVERAAALAPPIPPPGGLPAMPLLSRLPASALRSALEHIELEVYARAQAVLKAGQSCEDLLWAASDDFCVEAGVAGPREADEPGGRDAPAGRYRLPAGTLLGLNHFGGAPGPVAWDVLSHTNAELLRLPRAAIAQLNQQLGDFESRVTTLRRHALIEGMLERHPLFTQCEHSARVDLVQRFVGLHVAQGALLFAQGGRSPGVFLVLDGRVDAFLRAAERKVRVGSLGAGELFGVIGVVSDSPALADYVMAQPGHLLYLSADEFALAAAAHPGLARFAVQLANQRMETIRRTLADVQ